MKAVHQVTLDQGNWKNAWPVTGLSDPGRRKQFGMTATDAEVVNNMTKTMEDLEKRIAPRKGTKDEKDKEKNDY